MFIKENIFKQQSSKYNPTHAYKRKKFQNKKGEAEEGSGCANPLNPPLVYVNMQERLRERESESEKRGPRP